MRRAKILVEGAGGLTDFGEETRGWGLVRGLEG